MADDRSEIRHINWNEVFSFTHIFKSFRLAIHPSKLLLAFLAIALTWLLASGMNMLWKVSVTDGYVAPSEIPVYVRLDKGFDAERQKWLDQRPEKAAGLFHDAQNYIGNFNSPITETHFKDAYGKQVDKQTADLEKPKDTDELVKQAKSDLHGTLNDAQAKAKSRAEMLDKILADARADAEKAIASGDGQDTSDKAKADARKQVNEEYDAAVQAAADQRDAFAKKVQEVSGQGIFDAFADYEWACVYNGIVAVADGNIFKGLPLNGAKVAVKPGDDAAAMLAGPADKGFLAWVIDALRGVAWLLDQHILFALVLLVVTLAIWALLGGAIHRIAALHAARDEKISMMQALRFSLSKWPSFFTAPLIPLAVVFFFGAFIILGGLVGNLWGFGSVMLGVMLLLAIVMGLIIAFIVVGLVSGFALMYPTIAVEGSDSFDAISRSFAYIYARPWRAAGYSLVGLVYGVICYMFVRLFGFIALASTHEFLRWGCWQGGETMGASDKIAVIWQAPTFSQLLPTIQWAYLDGWGLRIGAVFAWIWVAFIVCMINAFLLTFCSSCSTVIYLLLRRKVDATDFDDVFVLEPQEKPLAEQPATTPAPAAAPAPSEPAAPTPPAVPTPPTPPTDAQ